MTTVLALAVSLLTFGGVYLVLSRRIFPAILGFTLLAHAANLVMMAAGRAGDGAPILTGNLDPERLADPLPQAFVLTAIVISMGITLYLLAVFVRSERSLGSDEVARPLSDDAGRSSDQVAGELSGTGEAWR